MTNEDYEKAAAQVRAMLGGKIIRDAFVKKYLEIQSGYPTPWEEGNQVAWHYAASILVYESFVQFFLKDNPQFDVDSFRSACFPSTNRF